LARTLLSNEGIELGFSLCDINGMGANVNVLRFHPNITLKGPVLQKIKYVLQTAAERCILTHGLYEVVSVGGSVKEAAQAALELSGIPREWRATTWDIQFTSLAETHLSNEETQSKTRK